MIGFDESHNVHAGEYVSVVERSRRDHRLKGCWRRETPTRPTDTLQVYPIQWDRSMANSLVRPTERDTEDYARG